MEAERDRFVQAIAYAKGSLEVLVRQIEEREAALEELRAKVDRAREMVQPLLLPNAAAVRD